MSVTSSSNDDCDQIQQATITGVLQNKTYKVVIGFVVAVILFYGSITTIQDRWYINKERATEAAESAAAKVLQGERTSEYALHAYKRGECWSQSKGYSEDTRQCEGEALLDADVQQNDVLEAHTEIIKEHSFNIKVMCEIFLLRGEIETCAPYQ